MKYDFLVLSVNLLAVNQAKSVCNSILIVVSRAFTFLSAWRILVSSAKR